MHAGHVVSEESGCLAHGSQGAHVCTKNDLFAQVGREQIVREGGVSHGISHGCNRGVADTKNER